VQFSRRGDLRVCRRSRRQLDETSGGLVYPCGLLRLDGARVPYARPASITDTTGVNNIIANNNFSGPNIVNLSGTYALEISVGALGPG
jgi:hypothetical protein